MPRKVSHIVPSLHTLKLYFDQGFGSQKKGTENVEGSKERLILLTFRITFPSPLTQIPYPNAAYETSYGDHFPVIFC